MHNDAKTRTLTAQVSMVGTIATLGTGSVTNQAPPKPHQVSVQPNTGQLSYTYPITVAPGPNGTTPTVQLVYSSESTNERYEPTAPADGTGDGWGLSMGSITMINYPSGSAISGNWYFLSGVANVSDRLIPTSLGSTTYYTEHVSRLKIQQVTGTQPCFHVWDTMGTYYEYGCTADSLQYSTDSSGTRTNYRWDLDRVVPANEGPNTSTRYTSFSYLQDTVTTSGHTTVRDAVLKQIMYGTGTSGNTIAGTVDFFYKGASAYSSGGIQWVTAYGTNEGGCQPPNGGPNTTLRCDDPLDYSGGLSAPAVMSTYSLQAIKSYVGPDNNSSEQDYGYTFSYQEAAYHQCNDARTGTVAYCAGQHTLSTIMPTVYQSGTGRSLPTVTFSYAGLHNTYYDSSHQIGSLAYGNNNYWYYLNGYHDHSSGAGETISYLTGLNNTHGTPNTGTDNRFDPTYCTIYTTCTGAFAHPDEKAWSVQLVHSVTVLGTDSSSATLQPATTTYAYGMSDWGGTCPADSAGLTTCTGNTWYPSGEGDWQDYYHGEFHGFSWVYITSPANDLTVQNYASTEGWGSAEGFSGNYTSGQLYEQDVYQGSTSDGNKLISKTHNTYAGNNSTPNSCYVDGSYAAYVPCETVLTSSRTTLYEQTGATNANAPWVEQDNTYDDYKSTTGFGSYQQSPATGAYHNLQQQIITSSNAPTLTKKWTYNTTDTSVNGQVYYNVHTVAHSEVDDAGGHVWSCQDTSYDEGAGNGIPRPAAGWPTTTTTYSNCGNHGAGVTLTGYTGYDGNGQPVATVDAVGVTTPSLYTSTGCTLSTAPAYITSNWSGGRYTSCAIYDGQGGMLVHQTNAFGQTASTYYDYNQGQVPNSTQDVNSQTTNLSYSYDASGNRTTLVKQPGETGSYTTQAQTASSCTDSSTLPCIQANSNSSLYSSSITRTFYDSQGRAVETLTPAADSSHTVVSFTLYNDAAHSVFTSQPFTLTSQSSWVDPKNYASTPGATATLDATGRTVSAVDALSHTTTSMYSLGSVSGDSNTYASTTSTDTNGHVVVSFSDALSRTVYAQTDSGKSGGTLTPNRQTASQYNVLNLPTSVIAKDLAPQSGQTITTVTTSEQYDDLGRLSTLNDPDRGTHTYSYDADGRQSADVSGSRTIGTSYDLLGRVGCLQDAVVTPDAHGACTSGANPFVKNTYDADPGGITWSGTNYAVGRLTQSFAINYFPGPDYTQGNVTQNMQYDLRGGLITERLNITATGGSLQFPTLPQYQKALSYNDANQLTMTQTTVGGTGGYTFTQAYDSTTGTQTGLSNNGTGVANLATLSYNNQFLVGSINYLSTSGSALASSTLNYDGNLRPTGTTATWQGGGNIYNESLSYDATGNVLSRATTQAAIPGHSGTGGSETQNFCYDEQNRLIWAANNGTVPSAGNGTCGNVSMAGTLGGNYTAQYAYTNLGQLWKGPLNGGSTPEQYLYCDSSHPHQLSNLSQQSSSPTCASKGTIDYTGSYDAWGNVTSQLRGGITRSPVYDGQDHLMRWNSSVNNQKEWYLYDGSGQRVLRRSYDGTNTSITVYAFGLEEHQYSYSGSGSSATNTGNTYYYTLGGQLLGTWDGTSSTTTFFQSDTLGSVVSSFNNLASGAVMLGNQIYGPYGNQRVQQGTVGTSKGFTGQYNDWLTGLDYYNARYYDPTIGQFLSADTVQGNLHGMDPYAYVGGNPETKTDPTGKRFIEDDGSTAVLNPTTQTISVYQAAQGVGYPASLSSYSYDYFTSYNPNQYSTGTKLGHATGISTLTNPKASFTDKIQAAAHGLNNLITALGFFIGGPEADAGVTGVEGAIEGGDGLLTKIEGAASDLCGGGLSFTPATKVATEQGKQTIGTVHPGEKVWAYNPKTKKMELQPILHVWINHDNDLVDLTITSTHKQGKETKQTSEVIHTNKKHPFLTTEKGFVPVGEITPGMHVQQADGQGGVVTGWTLVPGVMTMYNLEVAHDHTFVVGDGQWVVHNNNCNQEATSLAQRLWKNLSNNGSNLLHRVVGVGLRDDGNPLVAINEVSAEGANSLDPTASTLQKITEQLYDGTYVGPTAKNTAVGRNYDLLHHAESWIVNDALNNGSKLTGIGSFPRDPCEVCRDIIQFANPDLDP